MSQISPHRPIHHDAITRPVVISYLRAGLIGLFGLVVEAIKVHHRRRQRRLERPASVVTLDYLLIVRAIERYHKVVGEGYGHVSRTNLLKADDGTYALRGNQRFTNWSGEGDIYDFGMMIFEEMDPKELMARPRLAEVATRCISSAPNGRPSASEVINLLGGA